MLAFWGHDQDHCAAHSKAAICQLWGKAGVVTKLQTTRIREEDYGAVTKDTAKLLVNSLWLWNECSNISEFPKALAIAP